MSKEKFITISKEMLRYLLTLAFAAIGTYVGLQTYLVNLDNRVCNVEKDLTEVQESISPKSWLVQKQELNSRYISRLVPNQMALAKDCKQKLLFQFEDLRGE